METYTCCGKEFASQSALKGHKSSHSRGEAYLINRKKSPRTYNCIECNQIAQYGHSKENKFCSATCHADNTWRTKTKPLIEQGLCKNPPALKKYLSLTHGLKCSVCNQGASWNNLPLTLQLDHIDGNSDNNDVSNIRLLCPNCHTQTSTFGSKGVGNRYKKVAKRNIYLQQYKNNGSLAQR